MKAAVAANVQDAVTELLRALLDQEKAQVIVPAYEAKSGFWFGGGNMVQDDDGTLWLCGRYRNFGDSRTGLEAGTRGLECAVFRSDDKGNSFQKVLGFSKKDLSRPGAEVVSIEGTSLYRHTDGSWELYISTEKDQSYPATYAHYQKAGTGVWSIDYLTAPSPDAFMPDNLQPVLASTDPGYLHVKDPVVFDGPSGESVLLFCSHPMSWASSNSGYAQRSKGGTAFELAFWQMVERGPIWDVAVTRITDRLLLPSVGQLADFPALAVYFYDGAESMRQLDQNPRGHLRPRGYSCEEIGGAMLGYADSLSDMIRLSYTEPLFISPFGTGSSRYVSTLITEDYIYATWEQSQEDGSQPLVMNRLSMTDVKRMLE